MSGRLTIVGGTYYEYCEEPTYHELYGSGLRAAAALSGINKKITFATCASRVDFKQVSSIASTFGFKVKFHETNRTISFFYYHPLSHPEFFFDERPEMLPDLKAKNVLYYGMVEASVKVHATGLVYDPQNHVSFKNTGSTAEHLAIILNWKEALILSGLNSPSKIDNVGKRLMRMEGAEVVVIKNGPSGAFVFQGSRMSRIPVFDTSTVWPIGSGDIFSAVFAHNWLILKKTAYASAMLASQSTAQYCEVPIFPLSNRLSPRVKRPHLKKVRNIYLAGPFFSISQRWLVNEIRNILIEFGHKVFSPLHDVGVPPSLDIKQESKEITEKDLGAIKNADIVLAIMSGLDPGTLFEIGYARSFQKKVVVLAENVPQNDLTLFIGSDCIVTSDLTTALYKVSW